MKRIKQFVKNKISIVLFYCVLIETTYRINQVGETEELLIVKRLCLFKIYQLSKKNNLH